MKKKNLSKSKQKEIQKREAKKKELAKQDKQIKIQKQSLAVSVPASHEMPAPAERLLSKFKTHQRSLTVLAVVIVVGLGVSAVILFSLKYRANQSLTLLGEVIKTMGPESALTPEFKIIHLAENARQFVKDTLKDISSLPELPKDITTLDAVPLMYLPYTLREETLRKHNVARLEKQLADAEDTTSSAWIHYYLGRLYAQQNNEASLQKALEHYKWIVAKHPKHPLLQDNYSHPEERLGKLIDQTTTQLAWLHNNAKQPVATAITTAGEESEVVLTTTQGNITIKTLTKEYPTTVSHFNRLARSGFFNGLIFYKVEQDKIWTGCPLGNGSGGPSYTEQGEIQEKWFERGLVVMDNYEEKPGKIGSRFFIMKKYPWREIPTRYSILGKVTAGMEVVDKLRGNDILLDVNLR